MYWSLINIKRSIFKKTASGYNPNYFWIVTVQDGSKTSPANAVRSLKTLNFSNLLDKEKFLDEKSKLNAAFLIIKEES